MRDCILTLDAGTTGLKCTLFTPQGEALRSAVSAYGVEYPMPGWAQQPAPWFIGAAIEGTRQVLQDDLADRVAVIGLSGTMTGCIPIDRDGEALYPNIIHADARAEAQLAQIRAVMDDRAYYAHTGNRLDAHYTLPKILWIRENHPEVYERTQWFVNTKDVLYGWLTGRHGLTDFSDAAHAGILDIHAKAWSDALLTGLGIGMERMPRILPSHDVSGRLTRDAAQALGLPEGVPVSIGGGDGICAAHGAGVCAPGEAYMNIGSSAWLGTLVPHPVIDPGMRFFHYPDMDGRHYHITATMQCAASAVDWSIENLLSLGEPLEKPLFEAVEAMIDSTPPGAEGVFFLPTFMGERTPWWDPNARGTLIGMSLYHSRAHIIRAAFEGVAQALHLCDSAVRENGVAYDRLALVGGGAQSNVWPQMIADMFGMKARVHSHPRQATSLGAAMAAGVGIGLFEDYAGASAMAFFEEEYAPDPVRQVAYARHYKVYRRLYGQIRDAYRMISDYQAEVGG